MSPKPFESQGMRLLGQLFARGKRIFTMDDAKIAAKLEHIPDNQVKKILFNLVRQGKTLRLHRGLYVGIGLLGLLPELGDLDAFVISAFLIQPSAISHWSALQYHGLTEQIPRVVTASTSKKVVTPSMRKKSIPRLKIKHAFEIAGTRYEYVTVQEKHFFGIESIWIDQYFRVHITDKERTLLDVFIYPKMFGGMSGALGILETALSEIDIKKLVDYAIKYNKKSLIKRLGWSLEYFNAPKNLLMPLLKVKIGFYCRLDPSAPAIGHCDSRWMVQNNLIKG